MSAPAISHFEPGDIFGCGGIRAEWLRKRPAFWPFGREVGILFGEIVGFPVGLACVERPTPPAIITGSNEKAIWSHNIFAAAAVASTRFLHWCPGCATE